MSQISNRNKFGLCLLFFLLCVFSFSQKYNFVNWTVEDGLIQSQASYICQDNYRQLWIGTEGGICKFDGKKFYGYTVQDGLASNSINGFLCDKAGLIWITTNAGISVFNGQSFKTVKSDNIKNNHFTSLIEHQPNHYYTLGNYKLYSLISDKLSKLQITEDTTERITTLSNLAENKSFCFVHNKGLYYLSNTSWSCIAKTNKEWANRFTRVIYVTTNKDTLIGTNRGLYVVSNGKFKIFRTHLAEQNILCIEEDARGNVWIGTDKGVFKCDENIVSFFNSQSGFTDNSVNHIFLDKENNLWFATDADGIYKFRENTFTYFDKTSGLQNTIIMGVTQTSTGKIYVAGYGGGIYSIEKNSQLSQLNKIDATLAQSRINSLFTDSSDIVWVGTVNKGVWKFNEGNKSEQIADINNLVEVQGAICFYERTRGEMLIGTSTGLFIYNKKKQILKVSGLHNFLITSIKAFNKDCLVIGTGKGLYFLNHQNQIIEPPDNATKNIPILCLAQKGSDTWIGTTDRGVICWNSKNGNVKHYNTSVGLPSNFIYSIDISDNRNVWIGTGFGICNMKLNTNDSILAIKNFGRSDGLFGMECSHNGLLRAKDSSLWFGTTKGLFHFNPNSSFSDDVKPFVLLKSVKLFSESIKDTTLYTNKNLWFDVPSNLILKSNQNHLTFELGCIFHTNPEDIIYKYKLNNTDKDFTFSSNPVIVYPALPPGKYVLSIEAITKSGLVSLNQIEFKFEIERAFYQTGLFQFLIIVSLLLTGASVAIIIARQRQKRKQREKELLQKIREEEFLKLRERTAEDFHDEMGNNLTRISILSDVLKTKIKSDDIEVNKLIHQIKDNTNALYNGSRDIIWSLNAQNDGLYQVLEHIKDIGMEIFSDTDIEFEFIHQLLKDNSLKLKLDYSRNLTMIFKEIYNNILKHAQATQVNVKVELDAFNQVRIVVIDNGKGFNSTVQHEGNGLKNIQNRVSRLGGEVNFENTNNVGTHITIIFKTIFV